MSDATAVPDDDADPHLSVTVNEDGDLEHGERLHQGGHGCGSWGRGS
ncbi:hypothetical protein [Mycobacterium dioxanotrophicus]|nr:hypothetical protein [Mycobacterium dioxanotrophicus]